MGKLHLINAHCSLLGCDVGSKYHARTFNRKQSAGAVDVVPFRRARWLQVWVDPVLRLSPDFCRVMSSNCSRWCKFECGDVFLRGQTSQQLREVLSDLFEGREVASIGIIYFNLVCHCDFSTSEESMEICLICWLCLVTQACEGKCTSVTLEPTSRWLSLLPRFCFLTGFS